ncbi:hypothetical protein DL770_009255 [Monosporascus sp. CRB-9-2]|nr:hypothetical protein DL770_009255 [Monosporascus sp. CRB-9-2]
MTGGGDVDSITTLPQTTETALLAQARELLRKCKERAQRLRVGRPSRSLPAPQIGLVPPARDVADVMIQYDKFWSQTESAAMDLRLQVLLVIGISSSLHDHGDADAALRNMEVVHQWIFAAQTWLSGPLEKDRLNIAGLQIYCLTILARQIFSVGGDLVWLSMGSLMNEATQMGLHRDPEYLPAMPVLQAELRRGSGLPLSIAPDWGNICLLYVRPSGGTGMIVAGVAAGHGRYVRSNTKKTTIAEEDEAMHRRLIRT